jgi:DNA-binding CsgD family transcriptional regulator
MRPAEWLTSFGDRTVELVCGALEAEWGVFFLLDETLAAYGFRSRGAPLDLPLSYLEQGMERSDPLHPRRLASEKRRFTTLFDPSLFANPNQRNDQQRFWAFLQSFGARDAAEMIFWNGRRPVGGLSLIWRDKTSRCRDTGLAVSLRSFIEFNLLAACGDLSARAPAAELPAPSELSPREYQIADLVCRGYTNAEIAKLLGISLATVKTHLLHIFRKADVNNRAALTRYISLPREKTNRAKACGADASKT